MHWKYVAIILITVMILLITGFKFDWRLTNTGPTPLGTKENYTQA